MQSVFEAAGGLDTFRAIAQAWHNRAVADEIVGHAFSHGFRDDHVERIACYLAEALGGPPSYTSNYGDESAVVRMHSGNGVHTEMDQHAIACFDQALLDAGLIPETDVYKAISAYWAWATTHTMAEFAESADDVPTALMLPKWSWSGLIT